MLFAVVVSAHPSNPVSQSSLNFCRALVRQDFTICRLFFVAEGVLNSSSAYPINKQWRLFLKENTIEGLCCISSSSRYGLVDSSDNADIEDCFVYAGLGQLVEASVKAHRLVSFGARGR